MGNRSMYRRHRQKGFTIIELIIASTIFAIILLVIAAGITAIGRIYFKNETSARTQEAARAAIDDVARTVQFGDPVIKKLTAPGGREPSPAGINIYDPGLPKTICVGQTRYTFLLNKAVGDEANETPHALWVDKLLNSTCDVQAKLSQADPSNGTQADPSSAGKELLGEGMRLLDFDITEQNTVVRINIKVGYGHSDLFTHFKLDGTTPVDISGSYGSNEIEDFRAAKCRTSSEGGSFCSISELDTKVKRRIN